jgi:hypothetical protein
MTTTAVRCRPRFTGWHASREADTRPWLPRLSPRAAGTCVAIAGEDYCIVAADTRMSTGFNIMTRDCTKIIQLCVPRRRRTGVAIGER